MDFQAVLFDMDGVLVASEEHYFVEERAHYATLGAPLDDDKMHQMMGATPASNVKRIRAWYPGLDIPEKMMLSLHEEMLLRGLKRVKSLVPGVERWLRRIRQDGAKLAVASSSPVLLLDYAREHFRFDELFDTIVCGMDVEHGKPAPDIFLEAARRLGADPARCLVVEDSQNGVKAGLAAGMKVVAFTGALMGEPAAGAHWTIPEFSDAWYEKIMNRGV